MKVAGITEVYMTLEHPSSKGPPAMAPLQYAVPLGQDPGYAVQVMISEVEVGTDPEFYGMAAIRNTF